MTDSTTSVHREIRGIALPMIASNVSVPLIGIVDTAVLGHLSSPDYLAAVAIGASLFSIIGWGFGFLRMGTTGMVAQAFGADDVPSQVDVLYRSAVLALGIAVLLQIGSPWLIAGGLAVMEGSEAVETLADQYLTIRILGVPATLLTSVIVGWCLGRGDARAALIITIVANLTNVALNLLFVLGLGMNVKGVALASVLGETLGVVVGLGLVRRHGLLSSLPKGLFSHWNRYRRLLAINRDIFLRTLCLIFAFTFVTWWGSRLGKSVLAANAVLLNFFYFMSYALDGFAHAAEALVGRALGRGREERFRRMVRATGLWSAGVALAFTLVYLLFGTSIIHGLTDIDSVRKTAEIYLPWLVATPVLAFAAFWLDGVFIGATWGTAMRNTMLAATLVYVATWWLARPLGNHGLWLAFCTFMAARGGFMLIRYSSLARGSFQRER